jgi:hypothetical protein
VVPPLLFTEATIPEKDHFILALPHLCARGHVEAEGGQGLKLHAHNKAVAVCEAQLEQLARRHDEGLGGAVSLVQRGICATLPPTILRPLRLFQLCIRALRHIEHVTDLQQRRGASQRGEQADES